MDQRLMRAESLLDLGRHAEAEQLFRELLVDEPESIPALLGLGRSLTRQARHEEAEEPVRSAVALAPEDEAAYHVLVDVLCDRGDGAGALDAARRSVGLAPYDFMSHYQYARALLSLRRPRVADAYDAAVRAVSLAPHNADAHNLVGVCLDRYGNRPGAARAFRNALAIDPHHTHAQNNLASTALSRGDLGHAAQILRSAVGNDPHETLLHQNLDVVLLMFGLRVLWSLGGVGVVLGVLLLSEMAWWTRATTGATFLVLVGLFFHQLRTDLPGRVTSWGRGIVGRANWQGKLLIGLLVSLSLAVALMSLAPYSVALAVGLLMVTVLQAAGVVSVLVWIGLAASNLVRGR